MFFNTMFIDNKDPSYIYYKPNYLKTNDLVNWLDNMDNFKQGEIYGRSIDRLQKWYQLDNMYFCKKWNQNHERWKSHTYCDNLLNLQNKLQNDITSICVNQNIKIPILNSCLINLYRNGNDIISKHSDNVDSFGEYPTIIILSVGETRRLHFEVKPQYLKNNSNLKIYNKNIELEDGSLFIMAGSIQKYFYHSIEKEDTLKKRYSLTFREYIN